MPDRLDPAALAALWVEGDVEASAEQLRAAMVEAFYPAADEYATQYARALGLAGRGDEADAVLGTVIAHDLVVRCRLLTERGRRLLGTERAAEAAPLLQLAITAGREAGAADLVAEAEALLASSPTA